jgi:hypothetical protein
VLVSPSDRFRTASSGESRVTFISHPLSLGGRILDEVSRRDFSNFPTPELQVHGGNQPTTSPIVLASERKQVTNALRDRWREIQTEFIDEPRKAVEQADGLVASTMKRLAEVFAEERSQLEQQWDRGHSVSTEDLRVALQRYRTFFHRLLSA